MEPRWQSSESICPPWGEWYSATVTFHRALGGPRRERPARPAMTNISLVEARMPVDFQMFA
ncbi:hypothetical protein BZL30_5933 [Mycobacterium kansasii]|uniref:Uncharacterized protein n=1 Tax=Mycobacterium kansasii TaxID=1768 RepID=A0A1V3X165_MYCKA|nr:hypothetical protein BZL30_5933 [Mycobacterium kansasii]